jgi:hypothetical protein
MIVHMDEVYNRLIKQKGPIRGRYAYWKMVFESAAGEEAVRVWKWIRWVIRAMIVLIPLAMRIGSH